MGVGSAEFGPDLLDHGPEFRTIRWHRYRRIGRQILDRADVQAIRLLPGTLDPDALLADAGQAQQSVLQLVEVDDPRFGTDRRGRRRTAGLAPAHDQYDAEARIGLHAPAHHVHVARFENAQRQRALRIEHR